MSDNGVLLRGLDGSNPLAFLAALGTLRTLTLALPGETVKMSWKESDGAWRPRVHCVLPDVPSLIRVLAAQLESDPARHPVLIWEAWTSKDADQVRAEFATVAGQLTPQSAYTSAIGSDAALPAEDGGIADNPFRAARTDYFIKNLSAIISRCNQGHLVRALDRLWDYADAMENQSLRIDPSDDRRHAHQWSAPTLDDTRKKSGTMLGANRLAIEAYPYFQSCMIGTTLHTVGFGVKTGGARPLRWPIWRTPIAASVVPSVLALARLWEVDRDDKPRSHLSQLGIDEVFQCYRIKVGDSNPRTNFTPSAPAGIAGSG